MILESWFALIDIIADIPERRHASTAIAARTAA